VLAVTGCGGDDEPASAPPRILTALQQGGLVLVFRHAQTEMTTDRQEFLRSCSLQRNLSEAGRRQARAIGAAIRALSIPIDEVRASPMCRARETAELAFGHVRTNRDLVSPGVIGTAAGDERRANTLRALAERPPPAGKNTVLVTHTGNIGAAFGESVLEGEMLAYAAGARLVGRVRPEDWPRLVRAARAARE